MYRGVYQRSLSQFGHMKISDSPRAYRVCLKGFNVNMVSWALGSIGIVDRCEVSAAQSHALPNLKRNISLGREFAIFPIYFLKRSSGNLWLIGHLKIT